jgi:murein DD-endopeptidase MepM/ murein hydrolase activator NlpD
VTKGQLIAFVGNSGTPESIVDPASEMHLHWELRLGDSYLGKALPPSQVRALYLTVFAQPPAAAR